MQCVRTFFRELRSYELFAHHVLDKNAFKSSYFYGIRTRDLEDALFYNVS